MRSVLRSAWALYMSHLLTFRRSRTALYWTLGFPLIFLVIFGLAFEHGDPTGFSHQFMPMLLNITLISGSMFGVSMRMVNERENGILRRLRVTPVSPVAIVLAHGATALTLLVMALLLQSLIARLWFGFTSAGSIVSLAIVLLLGGLTLVPIGLVVGSVARDAKTAPAMTNFLFFPLMFLSGSAIPLQIFPAWMQRVAKLVPTTYIVTSLRSVIQDGVSVLRLGTPVLMLLATATIGVTLNALLFRWESTEPVRTRPLILALIALALIYGAAYVANPSLHGGAVPH